MNRYDWVDIALLLIMLVIVAVCVSFVALAVYTAVAGDERPAFNGTEAWYGDNFRITVFYYNQMPCLAFRDGTFDTDGVTCNWDLWEGWHDEETE